MRVERLLARVVAALGREDQAGRVRTPLLAALSRDTAAFGGTVTAGPAMPWSGPAAFLGQGALPDGTPPKPRSPAQDHDASLDSLPAALPTAPPAAVPLSWPGVSPDVTPDPTAGGAVDLTAGRSRSRRWGAPPDVTPDAAPAKPRRWVRGASPHIMPTKPWWRRAASPAVTPAKPGRAASPDTSAKPGQGSSPDVTSAGPWRGSSPDVTSAEPRRESSPDVTSAGPRRESLPDVTSAGPRRESSPDVTPAGSRWPGQGGSPAEQPDGTLAWPPRQAKREAWPPPLFSMPDASATRRMPSTTTRRLCAAVHLDPDLAARVVAELTDDPRRAVAPSVGLDLEPVLCHALRARLLSTAQDAFLTAAVLAALVLAPRTTVAVLLVGAAAGLCRSKAVRAAPPAARALLAAALVFGLVTVVGAVLAVAGAGVAAPDGELDRIAAAVGAAPGARVWAAIALLGACAVAGHLAHLWFSAVTLTAAGHPVPLQASTARRVAVVAAAQRGNVAFSRSDPFVGAGRQVRTWSVAVALRAIDSGGYRPRSPATLDPVLLRRHVGQALQGLGDGTGHHGVPGLTVSPYLAADGVRCDGDPLLGDGTPLPLASRDAVDAVVRGPQEGLRHYDRVVIVPRARGITTAEGRPVLPPDDGDGHVSVFVHTSIEASVVYVELSAHVLPPIRTACFVPAPVLHLELLTQVTGAPWRLTRTAAHRLRVSARQAQRGSWHDHSARLGIRDLVGDPGAALPALEAAKYVKIVERVVVEAVADFLERYDLDATTFRTEVPTTR